MIFLDNLKKLFTEELLTTTCDSYSKKESDAKFVEANGDSTINGSITVKSIKTNSNIELF